MSVLYPPGLCLSLLRPTRGQPYCGKGIKELWEGRKVAPVLPFERAAFISFRQQSAGRISISGVQEKISVKFENGELVPTVQNGRYILKPIPRAQADTLELVADVPANEHVTMQIASQVFRLNTPANGLVFFPDGEPAYIVRRFDYDSATGSKLTQEDFCQLTGRSRQIHGDHYKYTGSYEEMGRILKEYCPTYRIEVEKLFAQIIFNYVFGNGDAHLKNFSLLESSFGDHVLSPCYDLLCTAVHLPADTRTALDLFDDFETESFRNNGFFKRVDFLELADRYGMVPKRAEAVLNRFATAREPIQRLIERSLLSPLAKERFNAVLQDRLLTIR